jgi:hypothetical protein
LLDSPKVNAKQPEAITATNTESANNVGEQATETVETKEQIKQVAQTVAESVSVPDPSLSEPTNAKPVITVKKDDTAPICYNCGNQTQRAGSCYVCTSCGSTTGCS